MRVLNQVHPEPPPPYTFYDDYFQRGQSPPPPYSYHHPSANPQNQPPSQPLSAQRLIQQPVIHQPRPHNDVTDHAVTRGAPRDVTHHVTRSMTPSGPPAVTDGHVTLTDELTVLTNHAHSRNMQTAQRHAQTAQVHGQTAHAQTTQRGTGHSAHNSSTNHTTVAMPPVM